MDYGFLSIIPPVLAIVLAVITKEVFISLFIGIFAGELIMQKWAFFPALSGSIEDVVNVFADSGSTKTVIFSFLVGGIITVISASGGVEGFVKYLTEKKGMVKNRKAAMLLAYIIGVVIFIESSIKILITGTIARPLTDQYKVSREKLAYICDSTCAPICALIPLNGWGAMLMGVIGVQVANGVISGNPAQLLVRSLPFQFYCIITVLSVGYYIFTERDWGPMKEAEERVRKTGEVLRDGAEPLIAEEALATPTKEGIKPDMWNMILPLIVLIGMMPLGLYITGSGNIFEGSGSTSVLWAVLASLTFAGILYKCKNVMDFDEYLKYVTKGIGAMISMIILLIAAFAIGNVIGELGTGKFMAGLVEGRISGVFGPAIIFVLASVMAFATGTSWGTFAIMVPIAIQMAVAMDANVIASIGAAISGGIMGDHCSPISDTTILSSMVAATDHIDHVTTQLPYAILNGIISLILYIIVGFVG